MWEHPFWAYQFLNNSLQAWIIALAVFLITWIVLKGFYLFGLAKLKRFSETTSTNIDNLIIDSLGAIHWPFYVIISFYLAHFFLNLSSFIEQAMFALLLIGIVYYIIRLLERLINHGTKELIKSKQGEGEGIIKLGGSVLRLVLWLGALILILSNLGINVTSLIAGLGIGGIAVALALQNILGDLFSSLTILLDKPFKIGDFIVVGEKMGNVEKVGIKTTRVRLLEGEELIVANSILTSSQVRNFGPMRHRRVVFKIGVVYGTKLEKLKQIPGIIEEIIKQEEKTEVEFAAFKEFGDSSLVFETAFYIYSPVYVEYMKTRERINLAIAKKFQEAEIEMAFPTTTIYVKKD